MTIDCDRCTVRGLACANCAVTFVTSDFILEDPGGPDNPASAGGGRASGHGVELDAADRRALAVLANAGLIPPLRYAPAMAKAS